MFTESDIERLQEILSLKNAGFPVKEVARFVQVEDEGDGRWQYLGACKPESLLNRAGLPLRRPVPWTLPAGHYRLITAVRLPSGDQLSSWRKLDLYADEDRTLPLRLRSWALETLRVRVFFLLRGWDSLSHPTLAKVLARFPHIQVLLDGWAYDLEAVARHLGRDPHSPP